MAPRTNKTKSVTSPVARRPATRSTGAVPDDTAPLPASPTKKRARTNGPALAAPVATSLKPSHVALNGAGPANRKRKAKVVKSNEVVCDDAPSDSARISRTRDSVVGEPSAARSSQVSNSPHAPIRTTSPHQTTVGRRSMSPPDLPAASSISRAVAPR